MTHHHPSQTALPTTQQRYHATLLRYWREEETTAWRYTVKDLVTGEQYSFAQIDLLIAFLYQHMETQICQHHITDAPPELPDAP